jgi:hypothetical protein
VTKTERDKLTRARDLLRDRRLVGTQGAGTEISDEEIVFASRVGAAIAEALLDEVLDHDAQRPGNAEIERFRASGRTLGADFVPDARAYLVETSETKAVSWSIWMSARCPDCGGPLRDPLTGERSPKGTCSASCES